MHPVDAVAAEQDIAERVGLAEDAVVLLFVGRIQPLKAPDVLVRAAAELLERRPELRDSMRLEAFDPNAIYEKLNSIPDVRDAIGRAGMSPREYATATAALMQAAMVRQMRAQGMTPPAQVNENNVKFVDDNWAEIQQMMQAAAAQARPRS